MYYNTSDIDQQDLIKNLQNFNYQNWLTQYSQNPLLNSQIFCQSVTNIIETGYIFQKSPKNIWLLKDNQNCPSHWLNGMPRMKKLFEAVLTKNEQANLQPILIKVRLGASLSQFLLLITSKSYGFLETQKMFSKKVIYLPEGHDY